MTDLRLRAELDVDAAGAIGPLRQTDKATDDLADSFRQAGSAAATAADRVAGAGRKMAAASGSAATSARAQRAGYQQLGYQISDVAAQAAAGTSPLLIFAQQGGQVAQALSMMGGVAGRAGLALAGPFGAAALGAITVLGALAGASDGASSAGDALADSYGEAGVRIRDSFITPVTDAAREVRDLVSAGIGTLVDNTVRELDMAARAVDRFADFVARTNGLIPRALSGGPALLPSQLEAVRARQAAEVAARQQDQALKAQLGRFNSSFGFDPLDPEDFGRRAARAADAAEREARRAADAAVRESRRAADAAEREAARAAEAQRRELEALVDYARQAGRINLLDNPRLLMAGPSQVAGFLDARDNARAGDELSGIVRRIEADLPDAVVAAGQRWSREAAAELVRNAGALGQSIGGAIGRVLSVSAGLLEGLGSGNFRGLGGRAGGALSLFAAAAPSQAWKPVVDKLDDIFGGESGDGSFIKKFNSVVVAAGIGASVAGGSREGQIGGALGGIAGKVAGEALGKAIGGTLGSLAGPLGSLAGGLLGSALGGLFGSVKRGSVTVSGSAGDISVGAATGNGGQQRQNSERLGNSLSAAIGDIVDRLGGSIGDFSVSIGQEGKRFRVDTAGQGRTNKKRTGVYAFDEDADAAFAFALEDALRDGAVQGVSGRVQAALQRYAGDINRAVAEALKVQDLENLLADRENPFLKPFRDFERQAAERLKVARAYGFDLIEIERMNAEERNRLLKDQLSAATQSVKTLLDDLRFGARAEGSVTDRLAALGAERSRLQALVDSGDTDQIEALARVIEQQLDLSRQAYGATSEFAAERAGAITQLDQLVRQTEQRINDAAAAAQRQTVDKLAELNTTADEQTEIQQRILAALQAMGGAGGGPLPDYSAWVRAAV